MPSICRILLGVLLLTAAGAAVAAPPESVPQLTLGSTSRIYVTLVPRTADDDFEPRWINGATTVPSSLNLSMPVARRNRLEFSLTERDVLARGDRLQLRLASDAHILAQLLSGGQFSEVDDSWIAALGLASRLRLSYTSGPMELSVSARHKLGENDLQARLSFGVRF
ncbi:MAG TPA: hypothetical protein VMG60_09855 [Burkholderiaceae bacterium]|nr:hypothetical protein [Burkholderiaceae bacterium]